MQTFEQIMLAVGQWSKENFGNQECKSPDVWVQWRGEPIPTAPFDVCLGAVAPLLGIGEEVGELFVGGTTEDMVDAIGDIVIYACDFCARSGFIMPWRGTRQDREWVEGAITGPPLDAGAGIVAAAGRLQHVVLKRVQGIRGMADSTAFEAARHRAVMTLMYYLDAYVNEMCDVNLLTIANETWNGIVKKRDWKKDEKEGGGHDHGNSAYHDDQGTYN